LEALGRAKSFLNLTAEEPAALEALVASRSLPHGLVRRANVIQLSESDVSEGATGARTRRFGAPYDELARFHRCSEMRRMSESSCVAMNAKYGEKKRLA
jgi:hypothetical protein